MKIKIFFDFHDVFVKSHEAWIKAFQFFNDNICIVNDYNNKISKKEICKKYGLNYLSVEKKYREYLEPNFENIEFAKLLSKYYNISICSLSRFDRLKKDMQKFQLDYLFDKVYSKDNLNNKKEFLKTFCNNNDWVIYFNHDYNKILKFKNLIYIPVNLKGDLKQFENKSFTEHAKTKLLYNDLSQYYMESISNDTEKEVKFLEKIFKNEFGKEKGNILDCCCGVGRHDYILGNDGYFVTGIDISKTQIKNAKLINKNDRVTYKVMDMRKINLNEKSFDMAICMWTTYNYLSLDSDLKMFIKNVYHHQREGSILVLDSKNIPRLANRRVYRRYKQNKNKNLKIELLINKFVDNNVQNSQYLYFIEHNNKKNFYFDEEFVRFYYLDEIKNIASPFYDIIKVYGDFDLSNYNVEKSNRMITILKRR